MRIIYLALAHTSPLTLSTTTAATSYQNMKTLACEVFPTRVRTSALEASTKIAKNKVIYLLRQNTRTWSV